VIRVGPLAGGTQRAQRRRSLAVLAGTNDDADGEGAELGIVDPAGYLLDRSSPEASNRVTKLNAAIRPSGASLGEKCGQLHE
jgi:hypothetical protein